MTEVPRSSTIFRLVGVYDAEGSLRGEVTYWIGARLGRKHCALCDITHGTLRRRPEWDACRLGLPVAFDTYHLNDQPAAVRDAAGRQAPVVLAKTADGYVVLLGRAELEACGGSVEALMSAIEQAVAHRGLTWV